VRALTLELLKFVALYCLFDALQIIFVGALKGAGDTRFILFNTIVISSQREERSGLDGRAGSAGCQGSIRRLA